MFELSLTSCTPVLSTSQKLSQFLWSPSKTGSMIWCKLRVEFFYFEALESVPGLDLGSWYLQRILLIFLNRSEWVAKSVTASPKSLSAPTSSPSRTKMLWIFVEFPQFGSGIQEFLLTQLVSGSSPVFKSLFITNFGPVWQRQNELSWILSISRIRLTAWGAQACEQYGMLLRTREVKSDLRTRSSMNVEGWSPDEAKHVICLRTSRQHLGVPFQTTLVNKALKRFSS